MTRCNTNDVRIRLGNWMRQYRMMYGLSQRDLADLSNVDVGRIQKYETGWLPSGVALFKQIADAMGVTMDTLYGPLDSKDIASANSDSLKQLAKRAHTIAKSKGWWNDYDSAPPKYKPYIVATKIALIGTEVSEMLEAARKNMFREEVVSGKPEGVPSEASDILIRLLDLCEKIGIDINGSTTHKMDYNETRPIKHGNKAF